MTLENNDIPLICAVVLTWNDTELTRVCLRTVLTNTYPNLRVILVDNGSKDPCGETLKKEFPEIELVVLPQNRGFTGGANAGLRRALELDPEYIFFLNNDTIVDQQAIKNLENAMTERPDCGMASALLLFPNERRVQFYTVTVNRDVTLHYHHHVFEPLDGREWPTVEVEFVPACAILLRAKAVKEVGLFDEFLGTNWEDYDLCMRFLQKNWRLCVVGDAYVEHHSSKTTGKVSPYITYYFTRNRLICMKRYGSLKGVLKNSFEISKSFYRQIRDYGFTNWQCHKSFIRAFWDFFIGRRGEETNARRTSDA